MKHRFSLWQSVAIVFLWLGLLTMYGSAKEGSDLPTVISVIYPLFIFGSLITGLFLVLHMTLFSNKPGSCKEAMMKIDQFFAYWNYRSNVSETDPGFVESAAALEDVMYHIALKECSSCASYFDTKKQSQSPASEDVPVA